MHSNCANEASPSYLNLIDCVGFNDTSTLVGHFVLSPREGEKKEEQKRKWRNRRNKNIKNIP